MAYEIEQDYIPYGQSRSGRKLGEVKFIVAHDTGNSGSTAQGNVNWFKGNPVQASAHTFIDDKDIIEDVPLNEKAWHVRYNVTTDNRIFGADANDHSIGVELCFGGKINFNEAYKRFVWYLAYLCEKYNLNPKTDIVGHSRLDPGRKTDPENALSRYGKSFNDLIRDVYQEFNGEPLDDGYIERGESGKQVEVLQKQLHSLGYELSVDGSYGPDTESVVKQFQKDNGLTVDGYYGSNTQQALKDAFVIKAASKEEERMAENQKATGFTDVPKDYSLAAEIKEAKEKGITHGYGDGTFRPDEPVTRAEAVAFALRASK